MRFISHLLFLGVLTLAPGAHALETAECTEAHFAAQVARSDGRLLDAEEQLSRCGHPSCPGVLTQECGEWLKEVSDEIPSIVIVVHDMEGNDVIDFELQIDGHAERTGRSGAVRLDPGKHDLIVRAPGYLEGRQTIRLRVGEQHRRVRLLLAPLPSEMRKKGPLWPVFLAGGFAVVGAAGFTYFGLRARSSERDLEDCRPRCADEEVSAVRARYVASNVALGVGIAALAAGGLYFGWRETRGRSSSTIGLSMSAGAPRLSFIGRF